jgi:hypothetical protein
MSRSGFMGNATLIADVGEPTDGPAWRSVDGALYFTLPGSANPLRRVVPGGMPSVVAVDAGAFAPIGIATSGGAKMYVTERESIATLDVDDAGAVTSLTRVNGLGGTSFSDIASVSPEPTSYFVDVTNPRIYRFVPPNEMSLLLEIPDAGKTTAIAARDTTTNDRHVYVGASGTQYGTAIIVLTEQAGGGLAMEDLIDLEGIAPNGIAVDNAGRLFVAWAKGIDVFQTSPSGPASARPQDGHAALPIGAIPTSLTFGGADYKTLFVTTNKGKIYSVPVQTAGQPR